MTQNQQVALFMLVYFGLYAGVGYWCIWKARRDADKASESRNG